MDGWIVGSVALMLGVILTLGLRSTTWRGRIHYLTWGDWYIRFNPNPGFRIGRLSWDRYSGWQRRR